MAGAMSTAPGKHERSAETKANMRAAQKKRHAELRASGRVDGKGLRGGARIKAGAVTRKCMNFVHCGKMFLSHGNYHRLCGNCRRLDSAGPFEI